MASRFHHRRLGLLDHPPSRVMTGLDQFSNSRIVSPTQIHGPAARCARVVHEAFAQETRGRGECGPPNAPADGVTGSPGAFQASRASYGAVDGARRAAGLEGRRASLTLIVVRSRGEGSPP